MAKRTPYRPILRQSKLEIKEEPKERIGKANPMDRENRMNNLDAHGHFINAGADDDLMEIAPEWLAAQNAV